MGEIGANASNEANFDEAISMVEPQESIQVTANSGALSGLDSSVPALGVRGSERLSVFGFRVHPARARRPRVRRVFRVRFSGPFGPRSASAGRTVLDATDDARPRAFRDASSVAAQLAQRPQRQTPNIRRQGQGFRARCGSPPTDHVEFSNQDA